MSKCTGPALDLTRYAARPVIGRGDGRREW